MIKLDEHWSITSTQRPWYIVHATCANAVYAKVTDDTNEVFNARCGLCDIECPIEIVKKANFIMNNVDPYRMVGK